MLFYVYGRDRIGVGSELEKLVEEHWSYMDRFADRLVLRGPTLSDDGEEHTGSVHVVDLADRASAERFATEEPFWLAGLYEEVTTDRAVILLHRDPAEGTLITGRWRPSPASLDVDPDSSLGFVAVLTDDDESHTTGIVAVVTGDASEPPRIVQPFADKLAGEPVTLTAQRWSRGGRPSADLE